MVDRSIYHRPVMTEQVVDLLRPSLRMGVTVDAPFGGGGHSRALLAADRKAWVLAIDRDPDAAAQAAGLGRRLVF
ncbi:MAG: 16S rRNA (cytosine(1402)-N(4))-methyltransferase, partial [Actinobacteria bacterium]|nr:16S rRNA (cytosine(1402)-N(4))-methyltransferase [Actinomycetota bacterium]